MKRKFLSFLACGASVTLVGAPVLAQAQAQQSFEIPAGSLKRSLDLLTRQSGAQLIYRPSDVAGIDSPRFSGSRNLEEALSTLLAGTGLGYYRDMSGAVAITRQPKAPAALKLALETTSNNFQPADVQRNEPVDNSGEIIVTATKRAERLQNVPVSIVALSPAALAQSGVVTATELPSLAPGLTYSPSVLAKLTSFNVRGIGTYANTPALENSVGVAIDGVPLARMNGSLADLVDIDRVEVLKGPQGLLFGKNATAGLISIVTRKPVIGDNSGIVHASYGSFDEINVDATLNYSPSDWGAFRLTAWRFAHDGFVRGSYGVNHNDKNTYGVRLGVSVLPTENLTLTLIGQYEGRDEDGTAQTLRAYGPISSPAVIAYNNSIGYFPSERGLRARTGIPIYARVNNMAITGLADLDLGAGYTLSSITSYREVDDESAYDPVSTDAPTFGLTAGDSFTKYNQFTQEIRVASDNSRRFSFIAGLFYYDFEINDAQSVGLNGLPTGTRYERLAIIDNSLTNYAAFGEATFRVSPSFRLIGGLRQSHDRTRGSVIKLPVGPDVGPVAGPAAALVNFQAEREKYDHTSWRIGAQWDVARDIMVYATASTGYKGPGFNLSGSVTPATFFTNGVPNNGVVEAETVKSYETGIKSQFFDRRLTVNLTAYHSIFSNFQTTVATATVPTNFIIQNAEQLKSTGVEFEVSARPVAGLSIGVNGAYINARYTDYDNAPCYPLQPTLPAGSAARDGFCVGGIQSLSGEQLPISPKWTLNANARYETALGGNWRGFVAGDYSYRSLLRYGGTNNPQTVQSGYGIFNANVGFGREDKSWTVSVYVRNVFKKHFQALIRDGNGFYFNIPAYEAQRRIGAQLEVNF